MTKAQKRDRFECWRTKCRYLLRCTIHWGRRCNRQGGRKIPRIKPEDYYDRTIKKAVISG